MATAKIDIEKRQIIGKSGTIYHIKPAEISSGRWHEYEIMCTILATGFNLNTILSIHKEVVNVLKNGKGNAQGNASDAIQLLSSLHESATIERFQDNNPTTVIEFCALFCVEDGEDIATITEDQKRKKWEDWNTISHADFLLLSTLSIQYYREWVEQSQEMANKGIIQTLTDWTKERYKGLLRK